MNEAWNKVKVTGYPKEGNLKEIDELVEKVAKKIYQFDILVDDDLIDSFWDGIADKSVRLKRAKQILFRNNLALIRELPSIFNGKGEMKTALEYRKDMARNVIILEEE